MSSSVGGGGGAGGGGVNVGGAGAGCKYQWQWAGDAVPGSGAQDVWVPYDEGLCWELEAALVLGKPWVAVDAERSIDLLAAPMVQRRNDDEFCSRTVHRVFKLRSGNYIVPGPPPELVRRRVAQQAPPPAAEGPASQLSPCTKCGNVFSLIQVGAGRSFCGACGKLPDVHTCANARRIG